MLRLTGSLVIGLALLSLGGTPDARAVDRTARSVDELKQDVVHHHALLAHSSYLAAEMAAWRLRDALHELAGYPSADSLAAARDAWIHARGVYETTEAFRFYGGPIDDPETGVEPLVDTWPLDAAYVDSVEGAPDSGIVNDVEGHPAIDRDTLIALHRRDGPEKATLGWHVIELLLWGEARSGDGSGTRDVADFVPGQGRNAERRAAYLRAVADLLPRHLGRVRAAWEPRGDNYRESWDQEDVDVCLRRMLSGISLLSGPEMSRRIDGGSRDDLVANQAAITSVVTGEGHGVEGPGLDELARRLGGDIGRELVGDVAAATDAVAAIPVPSASASGGDVASRRAAVASAKAALDAQAEAVRALGRALELDVPTRPKE